MYNKSVARIKIASFLSPDIDIGRGTEQGHPLSPDLFKLYIQDLSSLLNSSPIDHPALADIFISPFSGQTTLYYLPSLQKAFKRT
jgi:hypothetical protein